MRETRILMGMPITIEILGVDSEPLVEAAYDYFAEIDARFSPFRPDSEVSAINHGRLRPAEVSPPMREILNLAAHTRQETHGYFDIQRPDGTLDPSGIVKGWSIREAAERIRQSGARDFFVDAGGDVQSAGLNADGLDWRIGIRNPFDEGEIIKIVTPRGCGIATSGSYVRGAHIYDPHALRRPIEDIVSLTVIGRDVLEADRFATAAFAMGRAGIDFLEGRPDLEGYLVDVAGRATQTSGFKAFVSP
jgi:thiamine biosynthesis lipoprotein